MPLQALQAASPSDTTRNAELDAELRRRFGVFGPGVIGTDRDLVMSNDQVRVTFNTRGGLPVAATLQDGYTRYGSDEPVSLWVREQSDMNVAWDVPGVGRVGFQDLHFKPISEGPTQLVLESDLGDNNAIRIVHKLEGYQVKTDINFIGVERLTERQRLFTWNALGQRNEKGLQWERQHSAIYYLELGEERDYLSDGQEDDEVLESGLSWMAFKQNYFSALVGKPRAVRRWCQNRQHSARRRHDVRDGLRGRAALRRPAASLLLWPQRLGVAGNHWVSKRWGASSTTDGGSLVGSTRNVILPVYGFVANYIGNMGLIILVLTLVIKSALFPITWKNYMSSAKMRVLRPELNEINERHKEDAMERQKETMELYRKTGVNPMAGCLPGLLQMPILYAMFRFFPSNIDLRGQSFLWADDLGAFDSLLTLPFSIPFYGAHVSGFTLLMAASMFVYMRMSMATKACPPSRACLT